MYSSYQAVLHLRAIIATSMHWQIVKAVMQKKDAKIATDLVRKLKARGLEDPGSRPDANTYNQAISILAKTKSVGGALEAQNMFDDMMNEANTTGVYPSTDTFNALMNCSLKSGPKRGRAHIERLLSSWLILVMMVMNMLVQINSL